MLDEDDDDGDADYDDEDDDDDDDEDDDDDDVTVVNNVIYPAEKCIIKALISIRPILLNL